MQRRTNMLSTVVLSAVMLCGARAIAADVPKEGPFTFSYLGRGGFVASFTVKDQTFGIWDNHTNYSANGLFDHGSARCLGTEMIQGGTGPLLGFCVVADPSGDEITLQLPTVDFAVGKSTHFPLTILAGTGKYAGISGSGICTDQGAGYHSETEGSIVIAGTCQGTYKLP